MSLAKRKPQGFQHFDMRQRSQGLSVSMVLIIVNVAIFVIQFFLLSKTQAQGVMVNFSLIPGLLTGNYDIGEAQLWVPSFFTLLSYQFMHGGIWHLLLNMFTLYFLGRQIEQLLGGQRFLLFYLLCGIGAGLLHAMSQPQSLVPTVGASGAISAIAAAFLLFYPRERLTVFIYFIPITGPAFLFIGGWFAWQIFAGLGQDGQGGGIAWWAHIGGFLFGVALLPLFKPRGLRYHHWFSALDRGQSTRNRSKQPQGARKSKAKQAQSAPQEATIIPLDSAREKAYRLDLRALRDGFMSKQEFDEKWGAAAQEANAQSEGEQEAGAVQESTKIRRSYLPDSTKE